MQKRKQNNGLSSIFVVGLLVPFVTTIVFFIVVYNAFGFYWGWIDDIYFMNGLTARFYTEPISDLFVRYYVFIIHGYELLYRLVPEVNWYGIFLYGYAFIACSLILFGIDYRMRITVPNLGIRFLILFAFAFVFLTEAIYMATFTTISILLIGGAFVVIFAVKTRTSLLTMLPLATLGCLIRTDTAALITPMLMVASYQLSQKLRNITLFVLTCFLLSPFWAEQLNYSEEVGAFQNYQFHIQNILDGGNSNRFSQLMGIDSARTFALFSWFSGDIENLLTDEYLESVSEFSPISWNTLINAKTSLYNEYQNSCCRYSEEYTPFRNWFIKGCIGLGLMILVVAFSKKTCENPIHFRIILLIFLTAIGTIIITAILFKVEYRFVYPLMLICAILIVAVTKHMRLSKHAGYLFFCLLPVLVSLRSYEYYSTSRHLQIEKEQKKAVEQELATKFENKLVLFDLFTMSANSPDIFLQETAMNSQFVVYGEIHSNYLERHKQYLSSICGTHEIVPFFHCLYEKRDSVIFAFSSLRVEMYKMYFKELYGIEIVFERLEGKNSALRNLKYSFVWDELDLDYYRLKTFSRISEISGYQ